MIGLCVGGPASGQVKSSDFHILTVPVLAPVQSGSVYGYGDPVPNTVAECTVYHYRFEKFRWAERGEWGEFEQGVWLPLKWSFSEMFAFIANELTGMTALRTLAEGDDRIALWKAASKLRKDHAR